MAEGIRRDLARGVVRAFFGSILLAVAARFTGSAPAASGIYAGLLLLPLPALEAFARRRRIRFGVLLALSTWLVTFVSIAFAHIQSIYASGVFASGNLDDGMSALRSEWTRLWMLPRGDLGLFGLLDIHWDSLSVSEVAVASRS